MKHMVDVDLPCEDDSVVRLRTYYDPRTCEIIFGTTFFNTDSVWKKAWGPEWVMWEQEAWQENQRIRQNSVCEAQDHCPVHCPNGARKPIRDYHHFWFDEKED